MDKNKFIKDNFGISDKTLKLVSEAEESIKEQFKHIENICEINQLRVMKAFADNRVSDSHFVAATGYGYDDLGRDTLDRVYADIMGAEDALVRHNFISGTHTISTALFAVLRPNDILVSITGKPYDTLEEVIGIQGEAGNGSLKDFGVKYVQIDLKHDGTPDLEQIKFTLTHMNVKAVTIQRSKGYGWRPTYSAKDIGALIEFVKEISPETICIVDNCYGEFVETEEPTAYGADLIAGSLIKNPGGGLAPTGGYIAGKQKYVELCAYRLTSVGIGKEAGASLGFNRQMYQGLFMAPHVVSQALKAAVLCSSVFEKLGFEVDPKPNEIRHDIIQSIKFGDPDKVTAFCQGIQKGAPVDSFVTPEPWDMPGYSSQVIMAAGAFVQGASIELSADAPIKPPYIAYMQGGLTYESAKLGIMVAADKMIRKE
ncbi:MAG: aminotransferase class I/II-fold pyridoxal phosphate-dependent enzyme [Hominilimicola sp.]|uniref:methionine gamma-lyase family protein n=1 Tax=Hominilimicola sp. TaxID=3073571 RepID=UPI003999A182